MKWHPPHRLMAFGILLITGLIGWGSYHLFFARSAHHRTPSVATVPAIASPDKSSSHSLHTEAHDAGLYFVSETPGALYEAPVLKSEVRIEVHGLLVQTTVRQHFYNPSNQWVEGIYVFPLPERSAVDRLRMQIGNRFIEGGIEEKEEAKRVYEQAKREGKRASLVSSARDNVFSTRVANVAPGEEVIIEIGYQDTVRYLDHRYSLRVPMVVAPRYVPGKPIIDRAGDIGTTDVPDAGDILAPLADPERDPINPVTLTVMLDPGFEPEQVASLYHPITIETQTGGARVITLADGPVAANRDFVLEWRVPQRDEPTVSLFAEQKETDTYLYGVLFPPESPTAVSRPRPRDLILVVDISGSMAGTSIAQVKEALRFILSRLHPRDRFNLITFESTTAQLFHTVRPATTDNLATALQFVQGLEANGGTEILPAITLALTETPDRERLRQVVVLTDGAIGYEAQVLETIHRLLGTQRLFTIGIGSAPNSYFMREAAEAGRGTFTYIGDIAETKERLLALFSKLEHPMVTDVTLAWEWPDDRASAWTKAERYPCPIPDLYRDEPITMTAKLPNLTLDRLDGRLIVTGSTGSKPWSRTVDAHAVKTESGVAKVWARRKIAQIMAERLRGTLAPQEARARIVSVALEHHLVTPFTSLVAVERERVRPPETALATHRLAVNIPKGWAFQKILEQELRLPIWQVKKHGPAPGKVMPQVTGPILVALTLPQTATSARLQLLIGWMLFMVWWTVHYLYRAQVSSTARQGERP
ncbi:MAG: marine proteobacterial sortase target protein [Nitrospirae bacterium]|nr:MAG: marine proteobacterial sortase target protein [Nitrospirota bacterium]